MCETKYNTDWKRNVCRVVHFRNFHIAVVIYCVYNENAMLINCKHVFIILFKFKHKNREETLNQKRKNIPYLSPISTCVSLKTKIQKKKHFRRTNKRWHSRKGQFLFLYGSFSKFVQIPQAIFRKQYMHSFNLFFF